MREKILQGCAGGLDRAPAADDPGGGFDEGRQAHALQQRVQLNVLNVELGVEPRRRVASEGVVAELKHKIARGRVKAQRVDGQLAAFQPQPERHRVERHPARGFDPCPVEAEIGVDIGQFVNPIGWFGMTLAEDAAGGSGVSGRPP